MLRVRDDDAAAFAELVQRHEASMLRFMRSIGPRASDAEDLVQETFLRLYRARHRYEPTAKFTTYLFTIAGNVVRNARRSASRRHEMMETDAAGPKSGGAASGAMLSITQSKPDASGHMPTRQIEQAERAEMVQRAIESLGERQRVALVLSRFEHMNYAEIAETMGITTKAVKSLLSRARVGLGEFLQEYVEGSAASIPSIAPEHRS